MNYLPSVLKITGLLVVLFLSPFLMAVTDSWYPVEGRSSLSVTEPSVQATILTEGRDLQKKKNNTSHTYLIILATSSTTKLINIRDRTIAKVSWN